MLRTFVQLLAGAARLAAAQNLLSNGETGPLLGTYLGLPNNATYDYVVVGGGNAGLTVASRLAENGTYRVAVIEAGGFYEVDNGNLTTIPSDAIYYAGKDADDFQPLIDWGMQTTPQPQLDGKSFHYARGKTLGGCSARNYMLYHRPTNGSLERWASDVGDESYSPDNVFPFYKKSVDIDPSMISPTNISSSQDPAGLGPRGGLVKLGFGRYASSYSSWVAIALKSIGLSAIPGLVGGQLLGFGFAPSTIDPRNGHRVSSESSFLQAAIRSGKAPTTYKNTLATRILFSPNKTVEGVECLVAGTFGTPGKKFTLRAKKEVILSAGTFQSPQLLMVSGIGGSAELSRFNITVISDLKGVGQNMWDHVLFGSSHAVHLPTYSAIYNQTVAQQQAQEYLTDGDGPLSIFSGGPYGFEKLPESYKSNLSKTALSAFSQFPSDWPNIEYLPVAHAAGNYSNYVTAGPFDGRNYAGIQTGLVSPLSRGEIKLQSASMMDLPLINGRWLAEKADQEMVVQMFKRQRDYWAVLVKAGIADATEAFPGPSVQTDAQILKFIQDSMVPIYHPAATNKMGRSNDSMAVVDSKARVFGVKGLRVVDASAFPFLPPGHPMSTVYMLAEKIAADILAGR